MIQYSKNAVIIIGGRQNFGMGMGGNVSRRTWIMDPTNEFELKSGTFIKFSPDDPYTQRHSVIFKQNLRKK